MNEETIIYIFNENGFIKSEDLEDFSKVFLDRSCFSFKKLGKDDIDLSSPIFNKFLTKNLEYTIYDHGYVMKIEGGIRESIDLLEELDKVIDNKTEYFVSPSQRVINSDECKYPRGSNKIEIARFLDGLFRGNDYSSALQIDY